MVNGGDEVRRHVVIGWSCILLNLGSKRWQGRWHKVGECGESVFGRSLIGGRDQRFPVFFFLLFFGRHCDSICHERDALVHILRRNLGIGLRLCECHGLLPHQVVVGDFFGDFVSQDRGVGGFEQRGHWGGRRGGVQESWLLDRSWHAAQLTILGDFKAIPRELNPTTAEH